MNEVEAKIEGINTPLADQTFLSETEKQKVIDFWNANLKNPPSFRDIIDKCIAPEVDSRSKKARALREFLASRQIKARTAVYQKKDELQLTDEQKEYITNNCGKSSIVEIARILFNNPNLTNLSIEARTIAIFVKELNPQVINDNKENDIPTNQYNPPKTITQALSRINRYVHNGIEEKKMTAIQKKNVNALIGYLHTYRFRHQIDTYETENDRILFESEFVRCAYDKHDLTEEEVDQYIIYANEVVIGQSILKRVLDLERQQDEVLKQDNRINQALVDMVSSLRSEYNQCVKRQQDLLKSLQGERSRRISEKKGEMASILNLVQVWKEEESRKKMILLGEMRKKLVQDGIKELASLDEVKARILGISEEEVLNG